MSDLTKNDINTNWCTIKSILSNLLNDYVPYRTTKSRHNLSWITNKIKRSMRKRDKLDKISHKLLLSKLHCYGIRNHTLSWISAFLSNRTQTTVVNGVHCSYVEVTSGVPQGSVLGPMLFLSYINDINNAIKSQIKLFADDSVLYRNIRNQNDQVILQNDLDTISSLA